MSRGPFAPPSAAERLACIAPVIGLPDGVEPVAAVVGFEDDGSRGVAVVGADWPQRPVLCLQPMTHGDGRYAEGRRTGLLEAAAMADTAATRASSAWAVVCLLELMDELQVKAGAP